MVEMPTISSPNCVSLKDRHTVGVHSKQLIHLVPVITVFSPEKEMVFRDRDVSVIAKSSLSICSAFTKIAAVHFLWREGHWQRKPGLTHLPREFSGSQRMFDPKSIVQLNCLSVR